ncbi:FAD-dependent oxidoreductase, partial [Candidatus Bathyarchaeota archaeon]|nr:FAD-dependent oxidoreductase [Candidatus Bathyarchaeota archaeon]
DAIKDQNLDRIVVSGDEPVTSAIRVGNAVQEAGLNPYLAEIISLREHCANPHRKEPEKAAQKARAIVLAAVEKAKLLEPLETLRYPIRNSALVIGGGIAGIQVAMNLAESGSQVHLVEKEPFLGGIAARAVKFFPTDDCALCVGASSCDLKNVTKTSRKCLYRSGFSEIPNLNIITNAKIADVKGGPGDYQVSVETTGTSLLSHGYPDIRINDAQFRKFLTEEQLKEYSDLSNQQGEVKRISLDVGAIVIATGFEEFDATRIEEYMYGAHPDVITQLELARLLDPFGPTNGELVRPSDRSVPKRIVMIQCVGSRDARYNAYCSSICCMIALKHSLLIKEKHPDIDVKICYIDIRSWGRHQEDYYTRAREAGVKFVKGRPTEIINQPETKSLIVDTEDELASEFVQIPADLVVLSTAFVPSKGTKELAEMLGVEVDEDGFIKEYNSKVRPTETKIRGIYVCGGATFPKDSPTTAIQAASAAMKASRFLGSGELVKDRRTAIVDSEICGDCEFCPVTCPYGAIDLVHWKEEHIVAQIDDKKCEGCGICVGTCPLNAIELRHARENQIMAQVKALTQSQRDKEPVVLAYCCSECGGTALDSAGMASMEYPTNVRVVKVP